MILRSAERKVRLMNRFLLTVGRLFRQFLGLFPSSLPVGMTAFDKWADSIINTYDLPTKDEDSLKWNLASAVIGLKSTEARKSKYYFVLIIRAGAAKQISVARMQDIKDKQKAAVEAAKAKQLAEATALSVDAGSNVLQPVQN